MKIIGPVLAGLLALLVLSTATLFTVDQRQNAMVFQFGELKDVVVKPGLYLSCRCCRTCATSTRAS